LILPPKLSRKIAKHCSVVSVDHREEGARGSTEIDHHQHPLSLICYLLIEKYKTLNGANGEVTVSNESNMLSSTGNHDTRRRRGKRDPDASLETVGYKKHVEYQEFGELVHRIVSETEKTHPHLMQFTENGDGFRAQGPSEELGAIMTKYFPRKLSVYV
jgi:hypothetical protein